MKILTEEFLRVEYVEKRRSISSISKETLVSPRGVTKQLKSNGIEIRSQHRERRTKDKVGMVRGRLLVVEFSHYDKDEHKTFWKCQCKCGNTCLKRSNELSLKNEKRNASCGKCPTLTSERMVIPQSFLTRLIRTARVRNIDVSITLQDLEDIYLLQEGKCALSGIKLDTKATRNLLKCTASVDRKDSSLGYSRDNIQFVHRIINFMKHTLPDDLFIRICHSVSSNNPKVGNATLEDVATVKVNKKRHIETSV